MQTDIRNRMLLIGMSNNNCSVKEIIDAGYDLAFTYSLDDMSNPAKTVYAITGADVVYRREDAIEHGYLDSNGKPLELYNRKGVYPISITSRLYLENFQHRLNYLREYTKWPFGLHIGGSKNLIEHTYPNGVNHSKGYWCYNFLKTHPYDPELTLMQYQVDVWEDITNEMIQMAQKTFPSLKMVTTAFHCPSHTPSKKNLTSMSCGSEIWYMLKRMSLIHKNWYNIFFDIFKDIPNINNEDRFMQLGAAMAAYNLRRNIIVGNSNADAILPENKANICKEAKIHGTPYLAYILGLHGGMLVNDPIIDDTAVSKKLELVKKYHV